jgi:predicted DNA-binding protein (UPF0251 family)
MTQLTLDSNEVKKLYEQTGLTIVQIAKQMNVSKSIIRQNLVNGGIKIKDGRYPKVFVDEQEVKRLYIEEQLSMKEISKIVGCSNTQVFRYLKKLGVNTQKKQGQSRYKKDKSSFWKGYGEIGAVFMWQLKKSAKTRNLEFNLTVEQIWNLYLEQDRKCALTEWDIGFGDDIRIDNNGRRVYRNTASLDRRNNLLGYTINNVWWLHKEINFLKHARSLENLYTCCEAIVKVKHKKKDQLKGN